MTKTPKPIRSIPCVDIPTKFLVTPYVSELHGEIVAWFESQNIVWKLCYLSGQYSIIFSEHSEALRFKLKMGLWEDSLKEPDYNAVWTGGTVGTTNWLPSTYPIQVTTGGTIQIGAGSIGVGGSGGSAGGGQGYASGGMVSGTITYGPSSEELLVKYDRSYYEYDTGFVVAGSNIKGSGI